MSKILRYPFLVRKEQIMVQLPLLPLPDFLPKASQSGGSLSILPCTGYLITPSPPIIRILAWTLASAPPRTLSLNFPSPCILCSGIGLSDHVPPQPTNLHPSRAETSTSHQEMRLQAAAHGILGIWLPKIKAAFMSFPE